MYPKDWPKCLGCGEPVMDGHLTCGSVGCKEAAMRDDPLRRSEDDERPPIDSDDDT